MTAKEEFLQRWKHLMSQVMSGTEGTFKFESDLNNLIAEEVKEKETEIERLKAALEKIADEEVFEKLPWDIAREALK